MQVIAGFFPDRGQFRHRMMQLAWPKTVSPKKVGGEKRRSWHFFPSSDLLFGEFVILYLITTDVAY